MWANKNMRNDDPEGVHQMWPAGKREKERVLLHLASAAYTELCLSSLEPLDLKV